MVIFASFWDQFRKQFRLVLESTFGALAAQKVTNMSSQIDVNIDIGKSRFRGRPVAKEILELVARGGVREKVNIRPGGKRPGRKEERKNERKEENKS